MKRRRRRRWPWVGGGVLLLLLVIGSLETVHLRETARELSAAQRNVQAAATALGMNPAVWTPARITVASTLNTVASQHAVAGSQQLRGDPLLGVLVHLPWFGDQAHAVLDLAGAVETASTALGDEIAVAKSYASLRDSQRPAGRRLLDLLDASKPAVEHASRILKISVDALDTDSRRPLIAPLRDRVNSALTVLRPRLTQLQTAASAAQLAPSALGATGPATYLVLFANPSELRPAGGYIGAAGTLILDRGTPSLQFKGTEQYDPALVHMFSVPSPLDRYLVFTDNSLGLGDAGWDPDFPTAARLSEEMFAKATGDRVAGTIQVDPYAVAALLTISGPVSVPGYGSFDSSNLFASLNFIVNVSHKPGSGKGALAPIAEAVIKSVLSQPLESYPRMLSILGDQVRARHLMFYMHSPAASNLAAQGKADGAVLTPPGDYVMVVDANVGGTKGDYYVKRSIDFKAEVPTKGQQRHRVVLTYDMPLPVDAVDESLNPARFDGGAYHDYLRVYLPENANVAGVSYALDGRATNEKVDIVGFAHGHEFVGAYARVPRGHTLQLTLDYSVPASGARAYQLYIQKESGVSPTPISVEVSYPGARYSSAGSLQTDIRASLRW